MRWTPVSGREEMGPGDPWRRVVQGAPSPFFDYWAPPIAPRTTLTAAFIQTWVMPLCLDLNRERLEAALAARWTEITPALVWRLLSERNWRARVAGAYLAALRRYDQFERHIGGHFLRSETPYAGQGYCLALARFGGAGVVTILRRYLDHYLTRTELIYDQCAAMGALLHIDPTWLARYRGIWDAFVDDKDGLELERVLADFEGQLLVLAETERLLCCEGGATS